MEVDGSHVVVFGYCRLEVDQVLHFLHRLRCWGPPIGGQRYLTGDIRIESLLRNTRSVHKNDWSDCVRSSGAML